MSNSSRKKGCHLLLYGKYQLYCCVLIGICECVSVMSTFVSLDQGWPNSQWLRANSYAVFPKGAGASGAPARWLPTPALDNETFYSMLFYSKSKILIARPRLSNRRQNIKTFFGFFIVMLKIRYMTKLNINLIFIDGLTIWL